MKSFNLYTTEDNLINMLQFKKLYNEAKSIELDTEVNLSLIDIIQNLDIYNTIYSEGENVVPYNIITLNDIDYLIYMYDGDNDTFIKHMIYTVEGLKDGDLIRLTPERLINFNMELPHFIINNKIYVKDVK